MDKHRWKKTDVVITLIVPVLSATLGSTATIGINRYFENKDLADARAKIETLTREKDMLNRDLNHFNYQKGASSRRPISYQLDYLDSHTEHNKKRQHTIDILGMNGLGPIHQGKRILSRLLLSGARMRILLLDPESDKWRARLLQENDMLNYNAAELLAAVYGLSEIQQRAHGSAQITLEVRLYAQNPDRSLIIVDRDFSDGFVMGNRYPSKEQKGKEGLEGESYIEPAITERGKEDIRSFDERWQSAEAISLPSQPFLLPRWSYKKQGLVNKN